MDSSATSALVSTSAGVRALLRERFGHAAFRPHQEDICEAVASGHDALVVMPTGAGKSLCYQLPGLARRAGAADATRGAVVVVSPLIALMDDQRDKLVAAGFVAERIHSGVDRERSRETCRQYLRGELDFLFIAPERLSVPGFPELLARRPPALVAIDEAHCISHWGHDFRPDYRMLGARLPSLRPAPIVALTATATPAVQDDIVAQLGLGDEAKRFIHGFRRENLALEVVDCAPTQRRALAAQAVADPAHRPAILYAPTRKDADDIAEEFAAEGLSCAAYHAGLAPKQREAVQSAFLKGGIEVVVATIAFGMGVDKPDVRTVVHLALPSSLEAYSQEVGRAGRDGRPSRAILLGSLVDTKMHGFFLERDYPPSRTLAQLWRALPADGSADEETAVERRAGLGRDVFPKALEKLWIHGGAKGAGTQWQRGHDRWEKPYAAQRRHKERQLTSMSRFLDDKGCRQVALLAHFGDDDKKGACGICDACDTASCRLRQSRGLTDDERGLIAAITARLRAAGQRGVGTGKLYSESLEPKGVDRRSFEHLLAALARGGRVRLEERTFERENGERVRYQAATLVSDQGADVTVFVSAREPAGPKGRGKARKRRPEPSSSPARPGVEAALRAWRLMEAKRLGAPAFTVFSDRVLAALLATQPQTVEALGVVPGLSKKLVQRAGHALVAIIVGDDVDVTAS